MFEEDWALLGLGATQDLAVIKRAYAVRLRVTRPDDDAEAYQALREAYERAQQWARWDRGQQPSEPEPAPEPALLVEDDKPRPTVSATDLVHAVELRWRRGGDLALSQALGEVPLAQQAGLSIAYADLVLRLPQLPDAFIQQLLTHFGWLDDFRSERLIGPHRVHALQEALADRFVRPIEDPAVLAQFAPLLHLHRLREAGRLQAARWFALRIGQPVVSLFDRAGSRLLHRLGIAPTEQIGLRSLFRVALLGRVLVLLLLLTLVLSPTAENGAALFRRVFGALVVLVVCGAAAMTFGVGAWNGFGLKDRRSVLRGHWQRWQSHRLRPWLGFGLLGLGMALAAWAASPVDVPLLPWLPYLLVTSAGALLVWPRDLQHGIVATGVVAVPWYVLNDWLSLPGGLAISLSLALAWVLFGCWIAGRPPTLLAWLLRPMLNTLNLCDRWGYRLALLPVALCGVLLFNGLIAARGSSVLICWVLSILALGLIHGQLEKWTLREVNA